MKVWFLTEAEIQDTVDAVSERNYGNNLEIKDGAITKDGRALRFTLKCRNSKGLAANKSSSGRRTTSATWEAHREVIHALFLRNMDARIQTVLADYRGYRDFMDNHMSTFYAPDESFSNAGSLN